MLCDMLGLDNRPMRIMASYLYSAPWLSLTSWHPLLKRKKVPNLKDLYYNVCVSDRIVYSINKEEAYPPIGLFSLMEV